MLPVSGAEQLIAAAQNKHLPSRRMNGSDCVYEKEGRDIVMADNVCEMMMTCRVRLECEEVCDGCKKHVEGTEIK